MQNIKIPTQNPLTSYQGENHNLRKWTTCRVTWIKEHGSQRDPEITECLGVRIDRKGAGKLGVEKQSVKTDISTGKPRCVTLLS